MGMAASQARYLTLVARKTNTEWEGQQINQARTALANQSANLFSQMLGLQVPDCPDTTDFTKIQYSFTDGINASVLENYYQLSSADPEYNYVVTHYYNTNIYTGSVKKLNDPQVHIDLGTAYTAAEYQDAIDVRKAAKTALDEAIAAESPYSPMIENGMVNAVAGGYTLTPTGEVTPINYSKVLTSDAALEVLLAQGAFAGYTSVADLIADGIYKDPSGNYATKADLERVESSGAAGDINIYKADANLEALQSAYDTANANVNTIAATFDASYVGNSPLTRLTNLAPDQYAELAQCCKDFENNEITSNLPNYFSKNADGTYTYSGDGVYEFKLNGVTQYTTLADLANSYENANDPPGNTTDSQFKLPYYGAAYISTKVEKTERALLETDGEGRFTSVKFEDDSVKYLLNCESITDHVAYDDAMNQYYYDVQVYEKTVADINARTEIIQAEDRNLELRLKKLDTEQSALSNEIDAVKKVVTKSVESGFKTFGE